MRLNRGERGAYQSLESTRANDAQAPLLYSFSLLAFGFCVQTSNFKLEPPSGFGVCCLAEKEKERRRERKSTRENENEYASVCVFVPLN